MRFVISSRIVRPVTSPSASMAASRSTRTASGVIPARMLRTAESTDFFARRMAPGLPRVRQKRAVARRIVREEHIKRLLQQIKARAVLAGDGMMYENGRSDGSIAPGRSCLFRIAIASGASSAAPIARRSSSVIGLESSRTYSATSQSFAASIERSTPIFSITSCVSRMPAVSTSRTRCRPERDGLLDRVARRARNVGDDDAVKAGQAVQKTGFSGVRAAQNDGPDARLHHPAPMAGGKQRGKLTTACRQRCFIAGERKRVDILVGIIEHGP